jgi:aromatic-L-amino-acid decarboxylase
MQMSSREIPADTSLELSPSEMKTLLDAVGERVIAHVASLPAQPAADVEGAADVARSLFEPEPPEAGVPAAELLDLVFDRAVPKSFNAAAPGYLAYIPGGGLFASAVADLVSGAVNRYTGVWQAAPALVQLETNVLGWLCRLAGLPAGSGGFLSTGGSLATFSAVVAARKDRLPEDFLKGTLYVSDQTHTAVAKAAALAGFPEANVRIVPSDEMFRLRIDLLSEAVAADRRAGLTPFFVSGNAGTTNTGAVDDLAALARFAEGERLWFHVDAAYGGFFLLTERGKKAMTGIDRADSIVLDPHKGLFVPYGTGALLVRDVATLRRAHSTHAAYLPHMQDDPGFVDFCEISPELSRAYRGLRVWLPLKLHGLGAFRRNLDEKLDLAEYAARELRKMPGVQIVAWPQLSVVAFRLVREGMDAEALDRLNRDLLDRVNARQRVHLSGTLLGGQFVLRVCVLSFRTHLERLEQGLEDIRAAIREISSG